MPLHVQARLMSQATELFLLEFPGTDEASSRWSSLQSLTCYQASDSTNIQPLLEKTLLTMVTTGVGLVSFRRQSNIAAWWDESGDSADYAMSARCPVQSWYGHGSIAHNSLPTACHLYPSVLLSSWVSQWQRIIHVIWTSAIEIPRPCSAAGCVDSFSLLLIEIGNWRARRLKHLSLTDWHQDFTYFSGLTQLEKFTIGQLFGTASESVPTHMFVCMPVLSICSGQLECD